MYLPIYCSWVRDYYDVCQKNNGKPQLMYDNIMYNIIYAERSQ